jgi:hypothetical protein
VRFVVLAAKETVEFLRVHAFDLSFKIAVIAAVVRVMPRMLLSCVLPDERAQVSLDPTAMCHTLIIDKPGASRNKGGRRTSAASPCRVATQCTLAIA